MSSDELNQSLATLAGGAAGGGLGMLAVNPMSVVSDLRAEKNAEATLQQFRKSREVLGVLNDLYTGAINLEDITEEARPHIEELLATNQEFLKDRHAVQQELKRKPPAELIRMEGVPKFRAKQLLPSKELLLNAERTVKHPAVAGLSLLGALGGHFGYQMHADKMNKEPEE